MVERVGFVSFGDLAAFVVEDRGKAVAPGFAGLRESASCGQRQREHLIDMMDDDHRVVMPDLFAHAAAMRDLLDHLGIERVTVVGHSLGGGIAMQFFYLFPERVERLVLVSSGGLGREVNFVLRSATLPGAAQVLSVVASAPVLSRVEAPGRGASKIGWKPGADVGAIWRGFSSLGDRESRRAFLSTTRAVIDIGGQSISAHDHLQGALPVPTMIVWGAKDRMIPASHALSVEKELPDCRVEIFDGAGHFPHLDDPDRFARVLREFIADDGLQRQPASWTERCGDRRRLGWTTSPARRTDTGTSLRRALSAPAPFITG